MQLNLHLLRMFLGVVEHQGFSRAAEALHVTQSAMSKAVRELEYQLGLPLLERAGPDGRSARGVRLTEGGQALYQHARGIFAMERAAVDEIRSRVELRSGHLRIGASTTVAGYWLPAVMSRFSRAFPRLGLELQVANTGEIGEAIVGYRIDVAFVEGQLDAPGISSVPWRDEGLLLVAAADSPFARRRKPDRAALAAQTWLVREQGSGTRQVTEHLLRSHGIEPHRRMEIGSNEAIARAAAAGMGIAVLPEVVVSDLLGARRLRSIAIGQGGMSRPLFRLELANRPRSPALQAFLSLLQE
ncbi:LysR substrate-binding domain-containing protein [Pseudoxanthomonas wuyuanensis]